MDANERRFFLLVAHRALALVATSPEFEKLASFESRVALEKGMVFVYLRTDACCIQATVRNLGEVPGSDNEIEDSAVALKKVLFEHIKIKRMN